MNKRPANPGKTTGGHNNKTEPESCDDCESQEKPPHARNAKSRNQVLIMLLRGGIEPNPGP